ncbi:MAG: NTP transferase domain-containing protein [Bacteroidetes bacterium]|nr:NTP transferase domain-containing protein [Bacteroidota bacterium]
MSYMTDADRLGSSGTDERRRWSIILAGGNGNRLSEFTRLFYDHDRPKQYCAFVGTRSMLQHTYDRTVQMTDPKRIITIVSGRHLPFVREQLRGDADRSVLVQPYCRETAASILLGLSTIQHQDPTSVTAIFPSDHFILDERKFAQYVRSATEYTEQHPEKLVLLGVRPDREDHGYGCIEIGEQDRTAERYPLYTVRSFAEKPARSLSGEYLWNTFVIIGRTGTLMQTILRCIPELHTAFDRYRRVHGRQESWHALNALYERIPSINFSSAVLEKVPSRLCVMDISDVGWNDWGEAHRIHEDVFRYDLRLNGAVPVETEAA